jgi:hypothetical protein
LDPKKSMAYLNRGEAFFALGSKKAACIDFQKGVALGEKDFSDYGSAYVAACHKSR